MAQHNKKSNEEIKAQIERILTASGKTGLYQFEERDMSFKANMEEETIHLEVGTAYEQDYDEEEHFGFPVKRWHSEVTQYETLVYPMPKKWNTESIYQLIYEMDNDITNDLGDMSEL